MGEKEGKREETLFPIPLTSFVCMVGANLDLLFELLVVYLNELMPYSP